MALPICYNFKVTPKNSPLHTPVSLALALLSAPLRISNYGTYWWKLVVCIEKGQVSNVGTFQPQIFGIIRRFRRSDEIGYWLHIQQRLVVGCFPHCMFVVLLVGSLWHYDSVSRQLPSVNMLAKDVDVDSLETSLSLLSSKHTKKTVSLSKSDVSPHAAVFSPRLVKCLWS